MYTVCSREDPAPGMKTQESKQLSSTALEPALRVSVPTNKSEVKWTCPQKSGNLLAHTVMKEMTHS